MTFWDGDRWVRPSPPHRPPTKRATTRDWIATGVMLAILAGVMLPLVKSQAAGPLISVNPQSAPAGATVTVEGRYFSPNSQVRIGLSASGAASSAVRTKSDGSLRVTVRVPRVAPGSHTISAVDINPGGRGARMLVLASIAFTILSPDPVFARDAPNGSTGAMATPVPSMVSPTGTATPTATPDATLIPVPTKTSIATAPPATAASTSAPASAPAATPATNVAPPPPPAPTVSGFISVCGRSLCGGGSRWYLYGASVLGGMDDPAATAARAKAARLNTIRVVNFLDEHGPLATAPYSEWHWARLDRVISIAGANGLKVILDLSTYRNLVANAGQNPYVHDWSAFIKFAANRRNTVTGIRYGDDPTIALIAIAGEVEPINTPDNRLGVTTAQVTAFFKKAFATWKLYDGVHPVTSGGLLHYGWDSGIDWRAIFAAADACSIHNYSDSDTANTAVVASYCASLGKPWITEEFGWERGIGDSARASRFQQIYLLQAGQAAAGVAFWNLGAQPSSPTFDVNTSTPLTLNVVIANAP